MFLFLLRIMYRLIGFACFRHENVSQYLMDLGVLVPQEMLFRGPTLLVETGPRLSVARVCVVGSVRNGGATG